MAATPYTAVIATRNRPEALALSLPLIVAQTRPPETVLIVDSSDDPTPGATVAARHDGTNGVPVRHMTAPIGMTVQRNTGLAEVVSDVTLFPDDDSLLFPDAMAEIMAVYDRDTEGLIGGVGAAEASAPPPGSLDTGPTYSMRRSDRLRARVGKVRFALEKRLFPDPFEAVAQKKHKRLPPPPDWLAEADAVVVPWVTGFRMSFRTDVARSIGFDEHLGRYALGEDTDMAFEVQNTRYMIGANKAKIYHHKAPARRTDGRTMGAIQILNRAYIVAKSGDLDPRIARMTRRFLSYKALQYMAGVSSPFGQARFKGAMAARRAIAPILSASPETRVARYLEARQTVFGGQD